MKRIIGLYWSGLLPTIVLIIIIALVGLLITMIVGPVESFLKTFIPNQYIFPGSGAIFVLLIIPLFLSFLARGRIKKYLGKLVKKIPLLRLIWKDEEVPSVLKEAIPVAAKFSNILIYGFLLGKSEIEDDTGFMKGKYSLAIFSPSLPIPFTSALGTEFEPKDVREVEIAGKEGRNQARMAIIQNKCLSLGQPLAPKIRYKLLENTEIKELPVIPKEERLAIIKKIEDYLERLRRSLESTG